MKKICVLFAFFALFFAVSCGSSSNNESKDNTDSGRKQGELYGECYPNATCNKGLVCDEEDNICIKDPNGNGNDSDNNLTETGDDGDSMPEQPDNEEPDGDPMPEEQPDNEEPDSDPDTSDSTDDADTSDSQPDEDADADSGDPDEDADTDSGDPDEPCTTIDAKLWWSPKTTDTMDWLSALDYCEKKLNDSNKCGYSDWHLPTIDELKMLLKWRRDSQCKVSETDDHLSFDVYWTCSSCCHDCTLGGGGECNYSSYYYDGRYSKLGDSGSLWSSSVPTEYIHSAWIVNFNAAQVYNKSKSNTTEVYVRCVRGAQ